MTTREQADEIARLCNDEGLEPTEAVERVGLDPEDDVCSEDSSCFHLDEDDNDIIDMLGGDEEDQHIILRRHGRRGNKTPWVVQEIRSTTSEPDPWAELRTRVSYVTPAATDEMAVSVIEAHLRSDTGDKWMSVATIALARLMAKKVA